MVDTLVVNPVHSFRQCLLLRLRRRLLLRLRGGVAIFLPMFASMLIAALVTVSVSWPMQASAQNFEVIPDVVGFLPKMNEINRSSKETENCYHQLLQADQINCSAITDQFCRVLHDPFHLGNLQVGRSAIRLGADEKLGIAHTTLADISALLEAFEKKRLPEDIQKRIADIIPLLKAHIANFQGVENPEDWKIELDSINQRLQSRLRQVAGARANARIKKHVMLEEQLMTRPGARRHEFAVHNKHLREDMFHEVLDDVLTAKYQQSDRWQRINRIFKDAKKHMMQWVRQQKKAFSPAQRRAILQNLEETQLLLPLNNKRRFGPISENCNSTSTNGEYNWFHNAVTLCVGAINGFDSEATIFQVFTHELGHVFDPEALAAERFYKSPLPVMAARLLSDTGVDCTEWNRFMREHVLSAKARNEPVKKEKSPVDGLADCVASKTHLRPFDTANVKDAAATFAHFAKSKATDNQVLSDIASPVRYHQGRKVENGFYRRPLDRLNLRSLPVHKVVDENTFTLVFDQEHRCQSANPLSRFSDKIWQTHGANATFDDAIVNAEAFMQKFYEKKFALCGTNCSELAEFDLAVTTREKIADHYANQVLAEKLKSLKTVKEKREWVALANAYLCNKDTVEGAYPGYIAIERQHSSLEHPAERVRRHSTFHLDIREQLNCKADPGFYSGFGRCSLDQ